MAQATHLPDVGCRPGAGPEPVAFAGETATRRSAQHLLAGPRRRCRHWGRAWDV